MKQNCTLFCTKGSAEKIQKLANDISGRRVKIDGEKQTWSNLVYQFKQTKMTMVRMQEDKDDDSFSKLLDATITFVNKIKTEQLENQASLVTALSNCTLVLAVTVEPEFDEISEDIVYSLLEVGAGVLFTGDSFLNAEGGLVLDTEGKSEEGVSC